MIGPVQRTAAFCVAALAVALFRMRNRLASSGLDSAIESHSDRTEKILAPRFDFEPTTRNLTEMREVVSSQRRCCAAHAAYFRLRFWTAFFTRPFRMPCVGGSPYPYLVSLDEQPIPYIWMGTPVTLGSNLTP
jgi:hypothetical protein